MLSPSSPAILSARVESTLPPPLRVEWPVTKAIPGHFQAWPWKGPAVSDGMLTSGKPADPRRPNYALQDRRVWRKPRLALQRRKRRKTAKPAHLPSRPSSGAISLGDSTLQTPFREDPQPQTHGPRRAFLPSPAGRAPREAPVAAGTGTVLRCALLPGAWTAALLCSQGSSRRPHSVQTCSKFKSLFSHFPRDHFMPHLWLPFS